MQAVLTWARERVLVPHAEHADPDAHPECLACRAQAALAWLATAPRGHSGESAGGPQGPVPRATDPIPIEWIELDPPQS